MRLAFLATDEPFHREGDYPGPHWAKTVAALNAAGVHQIGLAVESTDSKGKPQPGVFDSVPDQKEMAIATDALAPRGGVDCNGDGITDVDQGGPLVCTVAKQADNRIKVKTPGGRRHRRRQPAAAACISRRCVVQLAETHPGLPAGHACRDRAGTGRLGQDGRAARPRRPSTSAPTTRSATSSATPARSWRRRTPGR